MEPAIRERAGLLFSSLSNPTRLRIVELLCTEEKSVNEIAAELHLSQSGTSQHLANLTRAGVLGMEVHGTSHRYKVRGPRIPRILELIEQFCEIHSLYGALDQEELEEEEQKQDSQLRKEGNTNAEQEGRKERRQEKMQEEMRREMQDGQ